MAVSLGLTGGLALETKARRHSWRLFARAAAVVSCVQWAVLAAVAYRNNQTCIVFQMGLCEEQHANTRTGAGLRSHTPN